MILTLVLFIGRSLAQQICGPVSLINNPQDKQFDTSQNQCFGVWTKYIPYLDQSLIDTQYEWNIFSIQQKIQFKISFDGNQFHHQWLMNQDQEQIKYEFSFLPSDEYGEYEGLPFFHQLCLEREKNSIIIYDYTYNSEQFLQTRKIDYIFDQELKWTLEFDGYFYGQKSKVYLTNFISSKEEFIQYIETCQITICQKGDYIIKDLITISYNQQNITSYKFESIDEEKTFQLDAWVKFRPNENFNSASQQFLNYTNRATQLNPKNDYNWDVFVYDVVRLYIVYDSVNLSQNGFIAYTYSYNLPIPGDMGKLIQLKHLSSDYYSQMTSWIFIVLQKQNLYAQLYIYFSKSNYEITVPFSHKIYHFTPHTLTLRISGETRKLYDDFTGQLYYIHTKQCQQFDTKPVCHNTCLTCSGPLYFHCITCGDSLITKRILNPSSSTCDCIPGNISVDYQQDCKAPNQVLSRDILQEIPKIESGCRIGQWRGNNNQCFDCPQKYTNLLNLLCGDCYDNPNILSTTLVCTFDYIQDPETGVYRKKSRLIKLYGKNLNTGEVRLYEGVMKICAEDDQKSCNPSGYLSMDNQKLIHVICRPNYYYNESLCYPCSQFCLNCEEQNCIMCEKGYLLLDGQCQICNQNCLECNIQQEQQKCISCIKKYTYLNSQCFQCGSNTEICAYLNIDQIFQQIAIKCVDVQQYYLTFTQNCFMNDIEYCLIQYQYSEEINQSSFDILFQQLPKGQTQTLCALCKPQYINKLTSCEYNDQIQLSDNIVQYQGQTYNIIKMYDKEQLLKNSCAINYCIQCIDNYDQFRKHFCVQCQFGYYPDSISGICKACPINCYNCIMQHKVYKDAPRNQKTFNTNAVDDVELYEIICTECFQDKEFYDGNCIDPCDSSCKKCEKADGLNVCKQCYDSIQGKQLSISDNKCFFCQENCQFCQPKLDLNFEPTMPELDYMFRQCLIPYEIKDLFQDNFKFKNCQNYSKCEKIINMTLNVYCDYEQMQIDRKMASDQKTFDVYNFYYNKLFSYLNLTDFGEVFILCIIRQKKYIYQNFIIKYRQIMYIIIQI